MRLPPARLLPLVFCAACLPGLAALEGAALVAAKGELAQVSQAALAVSRAFHLIHEIAGPSVVSIHTREQFRLINRFELREEVREVEVGEGSGFVFHADDQASFVLTNSHVVLQTNSKQEFVRGLHRQPVGYDKIRVILHDGRQADAEYVGFDLQTDLAVLKIPVPRLPTVEWANSDQARVGDWVLALGYPFGVGFSATSGIISATDRSTGVYSGVHGFESFIQTDAAINPGNSGGPLFAIDGRVLGVNANIISRTGANIGLGFAIPANLARRVAEDLLDDGRVTRPMVGIQVQELTPAQAVESGLPATPSVRIGAVVPGSPAAEAGVLPGDVILGVNQNRVQNQQQFRSRIASCRIGEPLAMLLLRDGKELSVSIVPVAQEQIEERIAAAAAATLAGPAPAGQPPGFELRPFGLRLAADGRPGLVIAEVTPGGLAEQAGLAVGDRVLHEAKQGPLRDAEDVASLADNREVVLQVLKDGRSLWVRLRR